MPSSITSPITIPVRSTLGPPTRAGHPWPYAATRRTSSGSAPARRTCRSPQESGTPTRRPRDRLLGRHLGDRWAKPLGECHHGSAGFIRLGLPGAPVAGQPLPSTAPSRCIGTALSTTLPIRIGGPSVARCRVRNRPQLEWLGHRSLIAPGGSLTSGRTTVGVFGEHGHHHLSELRPDQRDRLLEIGSRGLVLPAVRARRCTRGGCERTTSEGEPG